MRIRLAVLVWPLAVACAQFQDLSTDRHGGRVLFSSSLSLIGEPRLQWQKLFEATQAGVRTWMVKEPGYDLSEFMPKEPEFFRLRAPQLSSDGRTVVWTGERYCRGGSGCFLFEGAAATVRRAGQPDLSRLGTARLSATGRWVLLAGWAMPMVKQGYLDLDSGKEYEIPQRSLSLAGVAARSVANDGTAVFASPEPGLHLLAPGGPVRVIEGPPAIDQAVIDNQARFAVYQAGGQQPWLGLVDLATRQNLPVAVAAEGCSAPVLTEDGTGLLFISGANWAAENDGLRPQAWLMDLLSGRLRQLTHDPYGIVEATISGDGSTVFAVTAGGALIRLTLPGGGVDTVAAQSPWVRFPAVFAAPGETVRLEGAGLEGAVILVNDTPVPAVQGAMDWLEFRLPDQGPEGPWQIELRVDGSPFQPLRIPVNRP